MNWIKDKVGTKGSSANGAPNQESFIVGSSQWLGNSSGPPIPTPPAGSFKNPESATPAVQNVEPNPYLYSDPAPLTSAVESMTVSPRGESKSLYPEVYKAPGSDGEEVEVLTGEQVLVTIPGTIVHLIDKEQSVHLATGDFSLIRYVQEKTKVVVIANVSEELKWPLVQNMATVKLDPTHYYFSIQVPKDIESKFDAPKEVNQGDMQTLNYGVTFPAGLTDDQVGRLRELDSYLERYSSFSAPTVAQKDDQKEVKDVEHLPSPQDPSFPGKVVSAETLSNDGTVATEETSAAFWTTLAPNVDDYNSKAAKRIASSAGHVIRGILWLSDTTVQQLDSGNIYMKSKFQPNKDPSKISPSTISNIRRVRKLTGMTDKVAKGLLGGILYTTGLFSNAVIKSPPGKAFFKLLPGEIALVSLDAFNRVFDAVEKAGTDVMTRSSSVTQDFVNHRYGDSAKELTEEVNKTAGHVASTAWTFTKIRKAFSPKSMVSKTSMLKAAAAQQAMSKPV